VSIRSAQSSFASNFFFPLGLEYTNGSYIQAFANNQIDGRQLLNLRPYELEELGIFSVGHQEIILEAVEHLKNFVREQNLFLSSTGNNKMIHSA
jgi:SAM domain (Sterile alpha motif)